MNLNLIQKTAIVCGSTQGIGRATAVELALMGANVTLIARNKDTLQQTLSSLDTSKGQVHRCVVADFSESASVKKAIDEYLEYFPDVHILINNTGGPTGGPIIEASSEHFIKTFEMHLINNQTLVKAVLPSMQKANWGRIVNIISTSVKQPIMGLGVSNTIRWAVASWAKTLSLEIAKYGITVNNVLPGFTKTGRLKVVNGMRAKALNKNIDDYERQLESEIPIGRFAEAEEVAAAVAFLCSPAASSINGINLPVDGGKTGSM